MASAGTLWIEMAANLARLQQDMNQAKGIVANTAKDIDRTIGQLKATIGALGVGISFHVLQQRFDAITESMARLQDATEKTGSTVEKMSQLEFFAKISGSSLEGLSGALAKLSKGMVQGGQETADTTQALKFLQLTAKDAAGNLKDPADLFQEIAKTLYDYKDGAGKAAIAQALLGKSGAEMLPTMKKIVELGAIEASVTAEQAQAAEQYQTRLAILNRQKEIMWNNIVGKMLPSMESFVKLMIEATKETNSMQSAGSRLAADGSIERWADSAAMGIALVIDAAKGLPAVFSLISTHVTAALGWAEAFVKIKANMDPTFAMAKLATGGSPLQDMKESIAAAKKLQEDASRALETYLTRDTMATQVAMARQIALRKAAREDAARDMEGSSRPGGDGKKDLNYAPTDPRKAAAELKLYEGAVKRLSEELGKLNHQSEAEKMNFELYGKDAKDSFGEPLLDANGNVVHLTGNLEKLLPVHKRQIELLAAEVDKRKQAIEVSKIQFESTEQLVKVYTALRDIQTKAVEADQQYLDDLDFQLALLGKTTVQQAEMNEMRRIDLKLRADLKAAADAAGDNMDAYDVARENLTRQAEDQRTRVRRAIADRTRAERDWLTGAQQAFNEYTEHATNAAELTRNAFVNGLHAVEDTLFEVLRHGKLQFSDFSSFAKDQLARIAAQEITLKIGTSIAGTLGISTAANAGGSILGNLALSGASPGLFGSASAYGAAVPGLTIGGEQAAMLAAQTGAFGMEGLAATAAAGGSAGAGMLAAIPGWGWALAGAALLAGGGLFGEDKGPKASDAALRRRANGDFGIEMNNVAGGDPDIAQVMALNAMLNDPSKFDPAKLSSLVDTTVSTGSPADTASLIALLSKSLQPAADSAEALAKAAEDLAKAEDEAKKAAEALAAERRGLEIRLMEATGDAAGALAAKRQLEMDATNDLNRELLRQIYAAEDAATAQAAATKAQEEAAKAADQLRQAEEQARAQLEAQRRDAVLSAVDTLRDAYDREASSLEAMASRWADASKSLRDYGDSLVGTSTGTMSYTAAARKFADVARRAQLGDLDAIAAFQSAGEQFRSASLAGSSTALEHALNVAKIQQAAYGTANLADRQESVALQQRDQLRKQTEELIELNGTMLTVKDAIEQLKNDFAEYKKVTGDDSRNLDRLKDDIAGLVNGQYTLKTEAA